MIAKDSAILVWPAGGGTATVVRHFTAQGEPFPYASCFGGTCYRATRNGIDYSVTLPANGNARFFQLRLQCQLLHFLLMRC